MRTGTLTFHGSHNYGSMLQAYSLQQAMLAIYGHNEIINFRSDRQKRMMKVLTFRHRLAPMLKDITHLFYYKDLSVKHRLFEQFIREALIVSSKEINHVTTEDVDGYDLLCSGSDQIWNPCTEDFDLAYLIPYRVKGKKISYAASMGPGRKEWPEPISKFHDILRVFDAISVREVGTKESVATLSGRNDIMVHCDPVFLLDKGKWEELIDGAPLIPGPYIFLYTLFANPTIIKCAKALSEKTRIPVVISNFTNAYDLFSSFKKHLKTGPKEFLNLLYNAEMVVTSSFHGTAFSILLNKPFVTINGMSDNRICNLLTLTGLTSRSVGTADDIREIDWNIDFEQANQAIKVEREKSISYLSQFKD